MKKASKGKVYVEGKHIKEMLQESINLLYEYYITFESPELEEKTARFFRKLQKHKLQ